MKLTLSVDKVVAEKARLVALALGKSLNQLVREYLEEVAVQQSTEAEIAEFLAMSGRGNSQGVRFDRDSTYTDHLNQHTVNTVLKT